MLKYKGFLASIFIFLAVSSGTACAGIKETGILTGFAKGRLSEKGRYAFVPLMFRIGFDLAPLVNKGTSSAQKEMAEFQVEPFFSAVTGPDTNIELGTNLLFKFGYSLTKRLYNYYEGGAGIVYMTQHIREQSTQFNFTPQLGAGLTYFLKDGIALNAGYRYRHLSNAGVKKPNRGIDVSMVVVGISFFR